MPNRTASRMGQSYLPPLAASPMENLGLERDRQRYGPGNGLDSGYE